MLSGIIHFSEFPKHKVAALADKVGTWNYPRRSRILQNPTCASVGFYPHNKALSFKNQYELLGNQQLIDSSTHNIIFIKAFKSI